MKINEAYETGYKHGKESTVIDITNKILMTLRKYQNLVEKTDDIEYKLYYNTKISLLFEIYDRIKKDYEQ